MPKPQAEIDVLAERKQETHDNAVYLSGIRYGLAQAKTTLLNRSGEHFKNGNDVYAGHCRDLASHMSAEEKEARSKWESESKKLDVINAEIERLDRQEKE